MSKDFGEIWPAVESGKHIRLGPLGRKDRVSVFFEKCFCDDNVNRTSVRWYSKSVVLFKKKESERRKSKGASVISRLDGLVVKRVWSFPRRKRAREEKERIIRDIKTGWLSGGTWTTLLDCATVWPEYLVQSSAW